jgi:hypothetical protein
MTFLLLASVPYFNAALPKSVWTSAWSAGLGYLPLLCAVLAIYGIPKMIKRFITWPRTGYVATPNELKLGQLVILLVFGSALGLSISLPFVLVSEIRDALSQVGGRGDLRSIILHGLKLLICVTLTVYLGRKAIRKRPPVPAAYDAALITEGVRQTLKGRNRLRLVRFTLLFMFVGVPLLICGVVFGLVYFSKAVMRHMEVQWPQLGMVSLLVASNAVLYLMSNGLALKQHRWKWLVLVIMLLGPLVAAPAIPYPSAQPQLVPLLEQLPPVTLCVALVWVVSGAATLMGFIRHNPPPSTEAG